MAPYSTLSIQQVDNHIAVVTLGRPEVLNAINLSMMHDLLQIWQSFSDDKKLRCIILTGAGKAFCAGADLKARLNLDIDTWQQQHSVLQQAMRTMLAVPIPIIAAVNGYAFGGGLELALASDFIYASENAIFAQSEVRVGIMPGAMGTQQLPRALGLRRAKELTFSAQSFNAQQALEYGLINAVFSADVLLDSAVETAKKIAANAPLAVRACKKSLNATQGHDVLSGYDIEVSEYNKVLQSADRLEGISAFNEKRSPHFIGE